MALDVKTTTQTNTMAAKDLIVVGILLIVLLAVISTTVYQQAFFSLPGVHKFWPRTLYPSTCQLFDDWDEFEQMLADVLRSWRISSKLKGKNPPQALPVTWPTDSKSLAKLARGWMEKSTVNEMIRQAAVPNRSVSLARIASWVLVHHWPGLESDDPALLDTHPNPAIVSAWGTYTTYLQTAKNKEAELDKMTLVTNG